MSLFPFQERWDKLLSGRHWGQLGLHPMADPESPVLGFAMMDVLGVDGVVVEDVVVNSPADTAGIQLGGRHYPHGQPEPAFRAGYAP